MRTDKKADLKQHPLLLLFHINLAVHHLNKACEQKHGLSIVQWCVLKHLIDLPGASAQILADAVGIHASTLTQSLRRLTRKGFIFVDDDPRDSRKKIISITREGKTALEYTEGQLSSTLRSFSNIQEELSSVSSFLGRSK